MIFIKSNQGKFMTNSFTDLNSFFVREGQKHFYKKGDIIFQPGDNNSKVMSIVSGVVKIYDCSSQSEERTVALFSQNHIIPN